MSAIIDFAKPLGWQDRPIFVKKVVRALADVEVGPGVVQRTCAAMQGEFLGKVTGRDRPGVRPYHRIKHNNERRKPPT
jgi:hypothetical protein